MLSFMLSTLSGFLLALPFFNGNFWLISWIGFIPLFFAWQEKSVLKVFTLSFVTGLVFFGSVIYWLIHVTFIGQILLIIYLSLYFGIFGMLVYLGRKNSFLFLLFFIPSLWVILEFLRSYLFTGFGWALLGYSQYKNLVTIQIADIGGAYAVSFIIVMINFAIYGMCRKDLRRITKLSLGITSCILLLLFSAYGLFKLKSHFPEDALIKVSVVQGNIPQELKWQEEKSLYILEEYIRLTKEAAGDNPEFIIWPESSAPGLFPADASIFNSIIDTVKEIKIPLLVGVIITERGEFYNSAILISKQGRIVKRYDKLHLVPFGEYIPLKRIFSFTANLTSVPIGNFTHGENFIAFPLNNGDKKTRFSVLICFEDIFPALSRQFVKSGANLLVNITNDAWFKRSSAPYQHMQASVFRAIENRKFLIRAANTGISCFIDPYGRIIDKVSNLNGGDIFVSGYKTQEVELNSLNTLYTRLGDIFVMCCFLVVGGGLIIKKRLGKT